MNKGKTVVILHGWKLNSKAYIPLVQVLKKNNFSVYVPNMPGNGVKENPKRPYTLDDYVKFIHKYLYTNNIRKTTLIGHSFGGRVGIKLAAKYPELIEKLILSGVPGVSHDSQMKISFFFALAKIGNMVFNLPGMNLLKGFARKLLYRLAGASDYYHTDGVMRTTFKNIIGTDLSELILGLKLPVWLVWGEDDQIVPVDTANKIERMVKNSKLVIIPGAGHDVVWAKPLDFVGAFTS